MQSGYIGVFQLHPRSPARTMNASPAHAKSVTRSADASKCGARKCAADWRPPFLDSCSSMAFVAIEVFNSRAGVENHHAPAGGDFACRTQRFESNETGGAFGTDKKTFL